MAMAELAGASWHAGLAKVAIVASKRGGEVQRFITLCVSIQVHFFLVLYQPKISSAYSDNRGEDVPLMSQRQSTRLLLCSLTTFSHFPSSWSVSSFELILDMSKETTVMHRNGKCTFRSRQKPKNLKDSFHHPWRVHTSLNVRTLLSF